MRVAALSSLLLRSTLLVRLYIPTYIYNNLLIYALACTLTHFYMRYSAPSHQNIIITTTMNTKTNKHAMSASASGRAAFNNMQTHCALLSTVMYIIFVAVVGIVCVIVASNPTHMHMCVCVRMYVTSI